MIQQLHEHQRCSVILAPPPGKANLVSYNHSGDDIEVNTVEENLRKQIDAAAGGYNFHHGLVENNLWRYYENWYGILERIQKRFPNLIIENCAGGVGRTDLGMLSRTHYTWISDYNVQPRTTRTLSTMLYALAPELTVRYMGTGMDAHIGGSAEL